MTENMTPETFVVGETVGQYYGESRWPVTVFAVNGDEVTAGTHIETAKVYVPRSDGKHVVAGSPDYEVMPTMIFHPEQPKPVFVPQRSFLQKVLDRFF